MKTRHLFFLAIFVHLLGISTLAARSKESALLRGTITNQKGEPVPMLMRRCYPQKENFLKVQ